MINLDEVTEKFQFLVDKYDFSLVERREPEKGEHILLWYIVLHSRHLSIRLGFNGQDEAEVVHFARIKKKGIWKPTVASFSESDWYDGSSVLYLLPGYEGERFHREFDHWVEIFERHIEAIFKVFNYWNHDNSIKEMNKREDQDMDEFYTKLGYRPKRYP